MIYGSKEKHIQHIQQIFESCQKYDINLNTNKYIFVFSFGLIVGCIIFYLEKFPNLEKIK